jgi:hypothetical protein
MAAAELSAGKRPPGAAGRAWLTAYLGLWGATVVGFAVVLLAGHAGSETTRRLLGLTLGAAHKPPPGAGQVISLAAHNIPIAAWPLLLGPVGAERHRLARRGADVLVAACVAANTMPVGAALAAYGPALLAYIPQLPLEWAGLAIGYGSWLRARTGGLSSSARAGCLLAIVLVLLTSAVLESAAVPHHDKANPRSVRVEYKRLRGISG